MAIQPSTGYNDLIDSRNVFLGEDSCENAADETSDAVLGENVEGIVDVKERLDMPTEIHADATDNAKNQRRWNAHEARRWSYTDQTRHRAHTEAEQAEFILGLGKNVVEHTPGEATRTGGQIGYNAGQCST